MEKAKSSKPMKVSLFEERVTLTKFYQVMVSRRDFSINESIFLCPTAEWCSETFHLIIVMYVKEGSMIYSNFLRTYNTVEQLQAGWENFTVNLTVSLLIQEFIIYKVLIYEVLKDCGVLRREVKYGSPTF